MPEEVTVEMRERKSRGRINRQGHLTSAEGVLRALKKSRDLEERQKLVNVDQSGESSDATPTLSIQSLRLLQPTTDVTSNGIGARSNPGDVRETDRAELDIDDKKVLIIISDYSSDLKSDNLDHPVVLIDTSAPESQHLRSGSVSDRVRSASQSSRRCCLPPTTRHRSQQPAGHRSVSSKRKSGLQKKFGKEEQNSCRVSFDTLNSCDKGSNGSRDAADKKKSKKKFHKRRFAKKTGKKLWKGVRIGCKFLWSGLALYSKPFGAMDINFAKVWEERQEKERKRRQNFSSTDCKYHTEVR